MFVFTNIPIYAGSTKHSNQTVVADRVNGQGVMTSTFFDYGMSVVIF